MAGEIFIVVAALRQNEALRRVLVAIEIGGDVIRAVLLVLRDHVEHEPGKASAVAARLGQRRHVGRGDAVGRLRRKFIRERRREMVRQPAGPLDRIAEIVEVLDLVFGRHRLGLRLAETGTARVRQIAEREHVHRMAVRADLAVDLETALQLRLVVFSERAGERPFQPRWRHLLGQLCGRGQRHGGQRTGEDKGEDGALYVHDHPHALAPRTDSEIEFGSGLVFSKMPSSGRTIRKKAK